MAFLCLLAAGEFLTGRVGIWFSIAAAPCILAVLVGMRLWYRSFLRSYGGEVCRGCNYPLKGLPAPGVCPECGRPFGPDRHAEYWAQAYRVK